MWDDLNRKLLNVSHCVINHRSFNGELINRQWQHVCVCVYTHPRLHTELHQIIYGRARDRCDELFFARDDASFEGIDVR